MRKCVWFVISNWHWWCCLTLWLYEVSWLFDYCLLVPSCNKHHLLLPPASFCYTQPFCTRKLNYRTLLTFKYLNVWLLHVLFTFLCLFVSVDLNKDMVYFKKKKAMKIHIRKPQPNDKRIWYAQWKTCRVLYRNKMCLKCNTWRLIKFKFILFSVVRH